MKLKADRATLLKALAHIQSVAEKRNTIPILANVLIAVRDGRLSFTATDMEIAIVEEVAASTSRNGATTAPAATLYEIMRKLPESAEIELDHPGGDAQLALRAGKFATSLVVLPVEDFPSMTAGQLPHHFFLPALVLRGLIDRTRFAISTEETRYYLNGIFFHAVDVGGAPLLRAVATDGHRLARVEIPAPRGAAGMPGVIAPRKAVNEVQKLLEDMTQEVVIEISTTKARFQFGDVILTTKLIDGTFPDYSRVIPSHNDKRLVVEKEPFAKAVDRVSTISSERGRAIKLAIADNKMTLSVNNPDSGSASEEIEVDYDSSPIEIGFNARYLLDIAGQLSGDTALIKLSDPGSPTIIQDRDGAAALFVLMPLRV